MSLQQNTPSQMKLYQVLVSANELPSPEAPLAWASLASVHVYITPAQRLQSAKIRRATNSQLV